MKPAVGPAVKAPFRSRRQRDLRWPLAMLWTWIWITGLLTSSQRPLEQHRTPQLPEHPVRRPPLSFSDHTDLASFTRILSRSEGSSGLEGESSSSSASLTWSRSCMRKVTTIVAVCNASALSDDEPVECNRMSCLACCGPSSWNLLHPSSLRIFTIYYASWIPPSCRMTWDGYWEEMEKDSLLKRFWCRRCRHYLRDTCNRLCTTLPRQAWQRQWWISWPTPGTKSYYLSCGRYWDQRANVIYNSGSGDTPMVVLRSLHGALLVPQMPFREQSQGPRTRQQVRAMSSRVASEDDAQAQPNQGVFSTRQGRPGPKSGGSCIIVFQGSSHLYNTDHGSDCTVIIGAWTDVRVGGRLGQAPPEAHQQFHTSVLGEVKLHGPLQHCMHSQATGIQLAQLMYHKSQVSPAFPFPSAHTLPEVSSRTSAHETSRMRSWHRTEPRFARVVECCLMPGLLWSLRALTGLCYRHPAHSGTFFPTRVLTGVFRRRPGIHPRTQCLKRLNRAVTQHDGVQLKAQSVNNHRSGLLLALSRSQLSLTNTATLLRQENALETVRHPRSSPGCNGRMKWIIACVLLKPTASVRHDSAAYSSIGDVTRPAASAGFLHAHGTTALRLTPCQKRSFKRAQVRAVRDGQTTYRGRLHTPASLSLASPGRSPPPRRQNPTSNHSPPASVGYYRVMTWNCGGLNVLRYRELIAWLQQLRQHTPVDIVCIQETRWKDCSEFSSEDWNCVHSGTGDAHAGVLFMIHRSVAPVTSIRFNHLVLGRMLHIRIETNPAVDLLGVYQHAWNVQSNPRQLSLEQRTQELLRHRSHIRDVVSSWTRSIPKRNSLMVLGDFNAALSEHKPNIGPGTQPHAHQHPDQADFQSLIVSTGLNALNTWGRSGNKAGTFVMHNGAKVQIDYMFSRLPCEPRLLTATAVPEAPVVHPTGFRHIPVLGFLRKPTLPHAGGAPQKMHPYQIRQALTLDASLPQRFREAVQLQLPHSANLHVCLQSAWNRVAPKASPRPLEAQQSGFTLKTYWQAKQQLRQSLETVDAYRAPVMYYIAECNTMSILQQFPHSLQALKPILRAWQDAVRFHTLDRSLRKQVRDRKKHKFDALVDQAVSAAEKGLPAVYKLVKQQAPKSSKRSIHFRSSTGQLLTPEQELQELTRYFSDVYHSNRLPSPAHNWTLQHDFDITLQEVQAALHALQSQKALPDGDTPAILWKTASTEIAQPLTDALNDQLRAGPLTFPTRWHESHLVLIPKPSKPPNCPSNLRPISLLSVEAKC